MTGTDLYKRTHKSVPVIFKPPCICIQIISFSLTSKCKILIRFLLATTWQISAEHGPKLKFLPSKIYSSVSI